MSEPMAVALNYGMFRRKEINGTAKNLMLYDMGAQVKNYNKSRGGVFSYYLFPKKNQGGRRLWSVYYTSSQTFIITFSYFLA